MARENKFASSGGAKETPAGKLMETIVEDVIKAKAMTFAQWHALSANPLVPLAIPAISAPNLADCGSLRRGGRADGHFVAGPVETHVAARPNC